MTRGGPDPSMARPIAVAHKRVPAIPAPDLKRPLIVDYSSSDVERKAPRQQYLVPSDGTDTSGDPNASGSQDSADPGYYDEGYYDPGYNADAYGAHDAYGFPIEYDADGNAFPLDFEPWEYAEVEMPEYDDDADAEEEYPPRTT